jgi:multisubunit Na+/H+ antiporter MnhE subunit
VTARLSAAVVLPLRFLWAVLVCGAQTVRVIVAAGLRVGPLRPAAFVRVRFAPMSETGAALLGCMISLTPGTTVIDIDMDAREMVLHLLDTSDVRSAVRTIRQFEPGLVAWFGRPA